MKLPRRHLQENNCSRTGKGGDQTRNVEIVEASFTDQTRFIILRYSAATLY
jgi:hypothetical protein